VTHAPHELSSRLLAGAVIVDDEARRARELVRGRLFAAEPVRAGPYVLLGRVGAGGLGIVYAAWDPQLDRKVAIKVLHRLDGDSQADARAQDELLGEARIVAQLSHPHIVVVYGASTMPDGGAYLAMEFVEGRTLAEWARADDPSWTDVLDAYLQAGEGLAAAHGIGVTHRDFKPQNAMIDAGGRVRVLDFGLAHGFRREPLAMDPRRSIEEHATTITGAIVGTPAYMAPEQMDAAVVDARADQFSFCVALWEALYGTRPFAGTTLPVLRLAIADGVPAPPLRPRGPRSLLRVLTRGLAESPAQRWPDMPRLLAALRTAARRRRRGALALVGGSLAVALGFAVVPGEEAESCGDGRARLGGAWDDERSVAVASALDEIAFARTAGLGPRVVAALEDHATRWVDRYATVCRAAAADPVYARDELDRRMGCLQRTRGELGALVDVLAHADREVATRALQAAVGLARPERCTDAAIGELAAPVTDDPAAEHARARLQHALALKSTGLLAEAKVSAQETAALAESVGDRELVAETEILLGELAGETPLAFEHFAKAMDLAAERGAGELAVRAATGAVSAIEETVGAEARAFAWLRQAEAWAARIGRAPGEDAALSVAWGQRLQGLDRYPAARAQLLHALALMRRDSAPALAQARVQVALAYVESSLGAYARAQELFDHALAEAEDLLGDDHPELVVFLVNSTSVPVAMGDFATARARLERAIGILEAVHGPDDIALTRPLYNLALVSYATGDYASVYRDLEPVEAIAEKNGDIAFLDLALVLHASALYQEDRYDEALPRIERAIVILEADRGGDDPELASHLSLLANILVDIDREDDAIAAIRRAVELDARHHDPVDPIALSHMENLGRIYRITKRSAQAVEVYEQVIQRRLAAGQNDGDVAEVRFALARSLWDAGTDRRRALELARRALATLDEPGTPGADANVVAPSQSAAKIAAWIAQRGDLVDAE